MNHVAQYYTPVDLSLVEKLIDSGDLILIDKNTRLTCNKDQFNLACRDCPLLSTSCTTFSKSVVEKLKETYRRPEWFV